LKNICSDGYTQRGSVRSALGIVEVTRWVESGARWPGAGCWFGVTGMAFAGLSTSAPAPASTPRRCTGQRLATGAPAVLLLLPPPPPAPHPEAVALVRLAVPFAAVAGATGHPLATDGESLTGHV
jgi:hypothetical protein